MSNCLFQKSALETTVTADQAVVANGLIEFDTNNVLTGCSIQHAAGSNTVAIICHGLYQVAANVDIDPSAAGDITVQLLNNGVVVPGAEATITGAAADTYSVAFSALLKVLKSCPCVIDNTANLQVQITGAATVKNANLLVVKLA